MTARELTRTIIQDVLDTTGITATAGIGTNLYLCKTAMDIVAKHIITESKYRKVMELISEEEPELTEYSHTLMSQIIKTVTVLSKEKIQTELIERFEVTQPLS